MAVEPPSSALTVFRGACRLPEGRAVLSGPCGGGVPGQLGLGDPFVLHHAGDGGLSRVSVHSLGAELLEEAKPTARSKTESVADKGLGERVVVDVAPFVEPVDGLLDDRTGELLPPQASPKLLAGAGPVRKEGEGGVAGAVALVTADEVLQAALRELVPGGEPFLEEEIHGQLRTGLLVSVDVEADAVAARMLSYACDLHGGVVAGLEGSAATMERTTRGDAMADGDTGRTAAAGQWGEPCLSSGIIVPNRSTHVRPTRPTAALSLLFLAGCTHGGAAPPVAASPDAEAGMVLMEAPSAENAANRHREVLWFRTAAEYRALVEQVYRAASEAVREAAAGREPGSWAVIMDADETVLDNSEFERRIAESGLTFEESMWSSWVREEAATLIPGAGEFIALVQSLGGHVAIVTNRDDAQCPATERNLIALGVEPAVVLCETDTGEKEQRFERVARGTARTGLPPLEVVAWVGDNIGDFPDLTQAARSGPQGTFEAFGRRYFVLPNPMYGSWMGNDWQ